MDGIKDLTETIVDEKTNDLINTMDDLLMWKDSASNRLSKSIQELKDLMRDIEDVNSSFINRLEVIDVRTLKPKEKTL